jgi:hypothetical protein
MITLIGDVHGKYQRYYEIVREKDRHPYTIQLGDFGFKYDTLKNLDPEKHKVLGGNHDNYDVVREVPHYLGDYGISSLNGLEFFYYRGAYSIDQQDRTIGINWWAQEEVEIEGFLKARELYRQTRPDFVISHDCPESVSPYLLDPWSRIYQNKTGWALQELFNIHKPKFWRFGHYHKKWSMDIEGTNFKCLDELEVEDI